VRSCGWLDWPEYLTTHGSSLNAGVSGLELAGNARWTTTQEFEKHLLDNAEVPSILIKMICEPFDAIFFVKEGLSENELLHGN
jgi:hypothetical protein